MGKNKDIIINHSQIHPTAIVRPGAKLGKNIIIGAYSYIGEHVEIGDDCEIGPCVVIDGETRIGTKNIFFKGGTIGCEPQEPLNNESDFLDIGNNNVFRENVIICHGTKNDCTRIGDSNLCITNSYIGPSCQIADHTIISHCTILVGHVIVEDRVIISPLSKIFQFTRIGKMVMVGAGSTIGKDIPPFVLVDGNPACPVGINVVGLRRNEVDSEGRGRIKRAYRLLFRSNLTLPEAIARIEQELNDSDEIDYLVNFLRNSQRGIVQFVDSEL